MSDPIYERFEQRIGLSHRITVMIVQTVVLLVLFILFACLVWGLYYLKHKN